MDSKVLFQTGQGFGAAYISVAFDGVLTLLLLKLGAREFLVGIQAITFPLLGAASIFFLRFIEKRYTRYFSASSLAMTVMAFLLLPLFFVAEKIGPTGTFVYFFSFVVFFLAAAQTLSLSWYPVVSDLVPEEERGIFVGRLRFILMALAFLLLRASSKILGRDPDLRRFFWVFIMLAVIQTVRPVFFSRIRFSAEKPSSQSRNHIEGIKNLWEDRESRKFLRLLMLNTLTASFIGTFLIPFLKLDMGMSSAFCVILSSFTLLGYGLSVFAWGKLNDSKGSRFVLFSALLYSPVFWFIFAHLRLFPACFIPGILTALYFCSGISLAGYQMATTTRRMSLAPASKRFSFCSYVMIFGEQMPAVIAAPIGGFLLERNKNFVFAGYGIYPFFFILAGFAGLFMLYMAAKMEPVKERPLKELFAEGMAQNLLKFRDIIVHPP